MVVTVNDGLPVKGGKSSVDSTDLHFNRLFHFVIRVDRISGWNDIQDKNNPLFEFGMAFQKSFKATQAVADAFRIVESIDRKNYFLVIKIFFNLCANTNYCIINAGSSEFLVIDTNW